MSRGLGKRQTAILNKLNECEYFYLVDLLPDTYHMKDYQALYRAAVILFNKRRLEILKYMAGSKKVLICRQGVKPAPMNRPDCDTNKHIVKVEAKENLPPVKQLNVKPTENCRELQQLNDEVALNTSPLTHISDSEFILEQSYLTAITQVRCANSALRDLAKKSTNSNSQQVIENMEPKLREAIKEFGKLSTEICGGAGLTLGSAFVKKSNCK